MIARDLDRLADPYDVVVVGGGITGVCVAREAAGRGLRTLIIDKSDFGHGTSAATGPRTLESVRGPYRGPGRRDTGTCAPDGASPSVAQYCVMSDAVLAWLPFMIKTCAPIEHRNGKVDPIMAGK
jgi:glycine/D-amino acid oxidase-like deaminating enzyme